MAGRRVYCRGLLRHGGVTTRDAMTTAYASGSMQALTRQRATRYCRTSAYYESAVFKIYVLREIWNERAVYARIVAAVESQRQVSICLAARRVLCAPLPRQLFVKYTYGTTRRRARRRYAIMVESRRGHEGSMAGAVAVLLPQREWASAARNRAFMLRRQRENIAKRGGEDKELERWWRHCRYTPR